MMAAVRLAVLALVTAACTQRHVEQPHWPDAPLELRDDSDRDAATDQFWVLAPGAERDRARSAIAAAIAARLEDAIAEERSLDAGQLLDELVSMWEADPQAIGVGLAVHADLLRRVRALFAKAGELEPAVEVLVVLAEVDPAHRADRIAELDEILAFADDLATSENGAEAVRAQPIALLQSTAISLPLPWLVDRYVELMIARQQTVAGLLSHQGGATMQLVRAHYDVLATGRRIANVLARAGRVGEIHKQLQRITGIGAERELSQRAETVADQPTAAAYAELASTLRTDEHPNDPHGGSSDPGAALAVCVAGLARFPGDPDLLSGAGNDARVLGRIDQAIAFYEAALKSDDEVDPTVALRLGKLYGDRIARLASGGRPGAASSAWQDVMKFTAGVARRHPSGVWQQAAALAESALGKGLASQGFVEDGRHALAASLERAPSIDAYETLSTLEAQVDRYTASKHWANAGIALLGNQTLGDRYRRAKLERLGGDALRSANKPREAAARYLEALRIWTALGDDKDLPRTIAAERRLELGRMTWWLGDDSKAISYILDAVDLDADTPSTTASAVSFLIEAGRFHDALDAFHRGLGEPGGSELYKTYMCLWVVAEARRRGEPADRLATDYLSGRRGALWYEQLAQAATGRISFARLQAQATTGPRKGELAFYGAVLGLDPAAQTEDGKRKLLRQVVDAKMIFDAEYDLARLYLSLP
jgi:tetratricopeptide (TPR) repeat protein